jgi:hypothetical protein
MSCVGRGESIGSMVKDGMVASVVVTTTTEVRWTVEMATGAGPYCGLARGLGAARTLVMNSAERSGRVCMTDGVLELMR